MNRYLVLLPILFLLQSCDREASNIDLPEFRQKLVVHSYLSPGDTLHIIKITSNIPVYGEINDHLPVGNLSGTVSNGTETISLSSFQNGLYFTDNEMIIESGKSYKLKILSSTGLTAESTCTVPVKDDLKIEADTIHEYRTDYIMGRRYKVIKGKIFLTDPAGVSNFYRVRSKVRFFQEGNYYNPEEYTLIGTEAELFTDRGVDGGKIFAGSVTTFDPYKTDSTFLIIYVLQTDESYYKYHDSFNRYSSGDSPFTEVSPLFTNITGGLGVFASCLADSLVIRL